MHRVQSRKGTPVLQGEDIPFPTETIVQDETRPERFLVDYVLEYVWVVGSSQGNHVVGRVPGQVHNLLIESRLSSLIWSSLLFPPGHSPRFQPGSRLILLSKSFQNHVTPPVSVKEPEEVVVGPHHDPSIRMVLAAPWLVGDAVVSFYREHSLLPRCSRALWVSMCSSPHWDPRPLLTGLLRSARTNHYDWIHVGDEGNCFLEERPIPGIFKFFRKLKSVSCTGLRRACRTAWWFPGCCCAQTRAPVWVELTAGTPPQLFPILWLNVHDVKASVCENASVCTSLGRA